MVNGQVAGRLSAVVVRFVVLSWLVSGQEWKNGVNGGYEAMRRKLWYNNKIKYSNRCILFDFVLYLGGKTDKAVIFLMRTIIEKERTGNEKGIEGRRGIFEKRFRKTGIWVELK